MCFLLSSKRVGRPKDLNYFFSPPSFNNQSWAIILSVYWAKRLETDSWVCNLSNDDGTTTWQWERACSQWWTYRELSPESALTDSMIAHPSYLVSCLQPHHPPARREYVLPTSRTKSHELSFNPQALKLFYKLLIYFKNDAFAVMIAYDVDSHVVSMSWAKNMNSPYSLCS